METIRNHYMFMEGVYPLLGTGPEKRNFLVLIANSDATGQYCLRWSMPGISCRTAFNILAMLEAHSHEGWIIDKLYYCDAFFKSIRLLLEGTAPSASPCAVHLFYLHTLSLSQRLLTTVWHSALTFYQTCFPSTKSTMNIYDTKFNIRPGNK